MERTAQALASVLAAAELACTQRGARLTANRRDVLAIVLGADGPITAYALLDILKKSHPGAVPPTVYRALDFLMEHGLVHKLERLNAYVGCVEGVAHGHGHGHDHPVQFLICNDCGGVTEVEDGTVAAALDDAARRTGFRPAHATVEVEGTCGECAVRGSA